MGRRGTEVAKQAADIVLTDDRLATLVSAVAEGRRVFDNIRRFVRYGVSGGLAELLVMLLGPFLGLPLPLLPGQILWVNLVTHGLPGVAIGSEIAEPDVLRRPPRPPREGLLTRHTVLEILAVAGLITTGCLGLAGWAASQGRPWQTLLFASLALTQLGVALTTRSDRVPFWRMSPAGNPFLFAAVAGSVLAVAAADPGPAARRAARHRLHRPPPTSDAAVGGRNDPRHRRGAHEGATTSGRRRRSPVSWRDRSRHGPRMRPARACRSRPIRKGPKSHQRCPLSGRSGPVDACLVGPIRPIVGGESRPNDRDKGCT